MDWHSRRFAFLFMHEARHMDNHYRRFVLLLAFAVTAPFIDAQVSGPVTPGALTVVMALWAGTWRGSGHPPVPVAGGRQVHTLQHQKTRRRTESGNALAIDGSAASPRRHAEMLSGFLCPAWRRRPENAPIPARSTEEESGVCI